MHIKVCYLRLEESLWKIRCYSVKEKKTGHAHKSCSVRYDHIAPTANQFIRYVNSPNIILYFYKKLYLDLLPEGVRYERDWVSC